MQSSINNPTEERMIDIYLENLKNQHGDKFFTFKEVRNNQKRIDLVEFKKKKNGFGPAHAIEFKIFHWKGGLKQALGNRVLMPYNSLAIWENYENKINRDLLKTDGIGLIIVSNSGNFVELKSKKSNILMISVYNKIRKNIKKRISE